MSDAFKFDQNLRWVNCLPLKALKFITSEKNIWIQFSMMILLKVVVRVISSDPPCKCPIYNGTLESFAWCLYFKKLIIFNCMVFLQKWRISSAGNYNQN